MCIFFLKRVAAALLHSPLKGQRTLAQQLELSQATVQRLISDSGLKGFRPVNVQALSEEDRVLRVAFALELLDKVQYYPDLFSHIVWTDEATFKLNGKVNTRNYVEYAYDNPHTMLEVPQKSPGINVWLGIHSAGLVGPFYFQGNITGQSYLKMLQEEIIPAILNQTDITTVIYQQDGAPPHWALLVRSYLNFIFGENWIGRDGPIKWPPRSPDLTPCDYFNWGYLRDLVYVTQPKTPEDLQAAITESCTKITLEMCSNACLSVEKRLRICIGAQGAQVPTTHI